MRRYPLIEEVDLPFPAHTVFAYFQHEPDSCFLDSAMDPGRLGQYSFIGSDPFLVLRSRGRRIITCAGHECTTENGDPFDALKRILERYRIDRPDTDIPLLGGCIGYFSYDLCHFIERLPSSAIDDLELPECSFAFFDTILAFDHRQSRAFIISTGFPELDEEKRLRRAAERLTGLKQRLAQLDGVPPPPHRNADSQRQEQAVLRSNFTHREYLTAVQRARDYIIAGDIFQVNLSQRFQTPLTIPPYELYLRLREINPAPFAAYLNCRELVAVSASPERFLQVRGNEVETRPIKGTRPRGRDSLEDHVIARELLQSAKDRAENVMIVDLERNDLGRVCRYGSVHVSELAVLETFPTVFHLTSTVHGTLREGNGRIELLKASFPGGSITGAPKVRAMEIIDKLEPTRRSVYTGSIGYLSFSEDMDLSIVIRTILIKKGTACFQVGGGIVYDSDPAEEYQETLDKGKALVQALQLASGVTIETR